MTVDELNSVSGHEAITNTLLSIVTTMLRRHNFLEPVDVAWCWTKRTGGGAWLDAFGVRRIEITHYEHFVNVEDVLWHETAHHVNHDCDERKDIPHDDADEEHPVVLMRRFVDSHPEMISAAEILAAREAIEEAADRVGAELKAEFEQMMGMTLVAMLSWTPPDEPTEPTNE
jgi:hypothetical protein